jgi:hypothetical protein
MLQRGIIIAGAAFYLLVMVVVIATGGSVPSHPRAGPSFTFAGGSGGGGAAGPVAPNLEGLPFRSVGIQIQRVDWLEEYKKVIDKVADAGADTVLLVVDTRQENGRSSKIWLDFRMTPTVAQLGEIIEHAKKRELRVILMPVVLLDNPENGEWRGQIHPESWDTWWASYRDMIQVFSSVAEVYHADMLVVGSELVSTEHFRDEWVKTIELARSNFHGKLTYSSNWDHYEAVTFWDQLDMVGLNAYWSLSKSDGGKNVPLAEIKERWKDIQAELFPFLNKVHKPLMFIEIGWFSMANCAREPWDYTKTDTEPVDLEIQKKLYQGFFESWWGNPLLGGFSIWEWPPNAGGAEDKGYTPEGKPALDVLKEWLKKGKWEVK